jgi:hypothetical protein
MIMTNHILLPKIDPAEPVTLSSSFNQELLRDRLGYRGVIVSDDIGMHAVSRMFEDPLSIHGRDRGGHLRMRGYSTMPWLVSVAATLAKMVCSSMPIQKLQWCCAA